jgi:hypothetical protein
MHSTSTACLALGARCLVGGQQAGSPMQCSSRQITTAGPVCAPLAPGGEEAGSRVNGFR